jgi:NADH:ubiquinone reductase (H+-translocating)
MNVDNLVIGGGYAGLTCALEVRSGSTLLVNDDSFHWASTRFHQFFSGATIPSIDLPKLLSEKDVHFMQGKLNLDFSQANQLEETKSLLLNDKEIKFKNLVLAVGAQPRDISAKNIEVPMLSLGDFKSRDLWDKGPEPVMEAIRKNNSPVCFIGGGATGIQMIFEFISVARKKYNLQNEIYLITGESGFFDKLSDKFSRVVQKRLQKQRVQVYFSSFVKEIQGKSIIVTDVAGRNREVIDVSAVFSFPGIKPGLQEFNCDQYGRLIQGNQINSSIFAIGDFTRYDSMGLNSDSAQSAVRKGKLVAANLRSKNLGKKLKPYDYKELGYFLSLGRGDGVGWMLHPENVIDGPAALVIKEAIEVQHDLYLKGYDTYLPFGNIFLN